MDLFICPGYAYETRISEKQCQYLRLLPDNIPYFSREERRPKACSTCDRNGHMTDELEIKIPVNDSARMKCYECGIELKRKAKSGLCKRCYTRIWARNHKATGGVIPIEKITEKTGHIFVGGDTVSISEITNCSVSLIFPDKYKQILDLLKSDADDQLRTVEHQVMWILKKHYEIEVK